MGTFSGFLVPMIRKPLTFPHLPENGRKENRMTKRLDCRARGCEGKEEVVPPPSHSASPSK
jgi:hypothetical protein